MSCNLHRFDAFCVFAKRNLLALFVLILLISSVFSLNNISVKKVLNTKISNNFPVYNALSTYFDNNYFYYSVAFGLNKNFEKYVLAYDQEKIHKYKDYIAIDDSYYIDLFFNSFSKVYSYEIQVYAEGDYEISIDNKIVEENKEYFNLKNAPIKIVRIKAKKGLKLKKLVIKYKLYKNKDFEPVKLDFTSLYVKVNLTDYINDKDYLNEVDTSLKDKSDSLDCNYDKENYSLECSSNKYGNYFAIIDLWDKKIDVHNYFYFYFNSDPWTVKKSAVVQITEDSKFAIDIKQYIDIKSFDYSDLNVQYEYTDIFDCNYNNFVFSCSVAQNITGKGYINITISDFTGYEKKLSILIEIIPQNDKPKAINSDIVYVAPESDSPISINLDTLFLDIDGDKLSYKIVDSNSLNCEIFNDNNLVCEPPYYPYEATITLKAIDPSGAEEINKIVLKFNSKTKLSPEQIKEIEGVTHYYTNPIYFTINLDDYFTDKDSKKLFYDVYKQNGNNFDCNINDNILECYSIKAGPSNSVFYVFASDGYNMVKSNPISLTLVSPSAFSIILDAGGYVPNKRKYDFNLIIKNNLSFDLQGIDIVVKSNDLKLYDGTPDAHNVIVEHISQLKANDTKIFTLHSDLPDVVADYNIEANFEDNISDIKTLMLRSIYEKDNNDFALVQLWADDADDDGKGDWEYASTLFFGADLVQNGIKQFELNNPLFFKVHITNNFSVDLKDYNLCVSNDNEKFLFGEPYEYINKNSFCKNVDLNANSENVFTISALPSELGEDSLHYYLVEDSKINPEKTIASYNVDYNVQKGFYILRIDVNSYDGNYVVPSYSNVDFNLTVKNIAPYDLHLVSVCVFFDLFGTTLYTEQKDNDEYITLQGPNCFFYDTIPKKEKYKNAIISEPIVLHTETKKPGDLIATEYYNLFEYNFKEVMEHPQTNYINHFPDFFDFYIE